MNDEQLEKMLGQVLAEFRRYRRGKWIARGLWMVVILAVAAMPWLRHGADEHVAGSHTALVDVDGIIGIGEGASAERINQGLRSAFENDDVKGIIVRVNSPGGSPVQASQINREIDRLQVLHPDIPVYAVVEEICASGGYYAAVAADEIYADPASIVGSIGVRMDSFGFVEALDKLGVERRLYTAGDRKGFLDPFLPVDRADERYVASLIDTVHRQFIDAVKDGRGDRLRPGDEDLFSGLFWNGEDALRLGLVDGFGSVSSLARDVIGEETIVNYTPVGGLLDRVASQIGMQLSASLARWFAPAAVLR